MSAGMRDLCTRCLRARSHCYCEQVRPFEVDFELVLLQHPQERKLSVGSARMAHLCIRNSHLVQGTEFESHPRVREWIADPGNHCVVLYPGARSIDVSSPGWAPPTGRRLVVFVIDGTWTVAKRMLVRSPNLMALPQIRFNPKRPSEYGFRRQPRRECLSTLEAVHDLLEFLEPSAPRANLLEIFRGMVSAQLKYTQGRISL